MVTAGGGGQPTTTPRRIEGGSQILSAGVRKTIQTIKEIVGNHSDADIYFALKDCNMDANETAQKLLNQDPFHEVKRRRDKKNENMGYKSLTEPRKNSENFGKTMRFRTYADHRLRAYADHTYRSAYVQHNSRRGGYNRNALPDAGINREFRVVRDNRLNPESNQEMKSPALESSISTNEQITNVKEKGSPTGILSGQKPSGGQSLSEVSNGLADLQPRHACDPNIIGSDRKELSGEKLTSSSVSRPQAVKPNNSQAHSVMLASSNSVGGYFSSKDPVHVPSPDSRASSAVRAIRREVGVVGGGRQSTENAVRDSSAPRSSFSNPILGREKSDSFRPFSAISKDDQLNQTAATESGAASIPTNRALFTNQYTGRSHHQSVGHQKASQHNKEWKPKSSQKSNVIGHGVIGTPTKSTPPPGDDSKDLESVAAKLQDELSRVNIHENQNVIIAQHIRVPETDRCRLTFGSFGVDFDSSWNFVPGFQAVGASEESNGESDASLTGATPKMSGNDVSGTKPVDNNLDDNVRNSGSNSPASDEASEHQLPDDIKDASSPQNLDNYTGIGLVRDNDPSYDLSESQQQQDTSELASFSAYDPSTGYDMPYFRPTMEESVRGHSLPSPQEALGSHSANSIPASSIAMVQQQQQQMAQMYPQVHVSHFTNMLPYRQIISPVYVPQMAMPGYSSNPAYPHPSNGSSYLLMPGSSSHLGTNSLKYGLQQFKPVPAASPTGFGNFTSPTGYAINAPSVVGSATGLEDSSRMKYKDGNLYVPNQQAAETSELWIHNPRELPGLQSAPYYNMPAQTPHATAYLPSHAGHASFNAAVPQSSHMQFPGMYHPTAQPPAMANPHHMGPAMGGNVGVGVPPAAPGAQVGAYHQQQPQLGNFNWSPNF